MTNITINELKKMNDSEFIQYLHKFPFPSMWENKTVLSWVNHNLCLIQGRRYIQTGNINSFKTTRL